MKKAVRRLEAPRLNSQERIKAFEPPRQLSTQKPKKLKNVSLLKKKLCVNNNSDGRGEGEGEEK